MVVDDGSNYENVAVTINAWGRVIPHLYDKGDAAAEERKN